MAWSNPSSKCRLSPLHNSLEVARLTRRSPDWPHSGRITCDFQKWMRMRRGQIGVFHRSGREYLHKSGCEWFQNIQKRMRTVFKLLQCPYSAFAPPVLEGYGRSLRRTFLNQESVRRTRRAANRFLMPSEHFKQPFRARYRDYSQDLLWDKPEREYSARLLGHSLQRFDGPFLPQLHDHPYRLRGASPLTAPGDTNVSAHLVMVWATCISSLVYMWSAFSIMTVSTRLGPLD